ncbi:hypothetical protein ABK040_007270 [Willaertia magna]
MSSIYVLEDFRKQGEADFHLFQSLINDKENKEENLSEKKVDSNDLFNTGYVSSLMGLLMNLKKLSKAAQVSFGTISKETEAIVENLNNLEGRYKIVKDKVIKSCEMLENTNEFIFGNEKYPVTYPQPQQGRFNTESFPDGLYEQYLNTSNNHSHSVTNPKIPPPPIPVIKVENEVRTDIPLPPNFVVCESKIPSPPSFEDNKSSIPPPPLSTFNIPPPRSNPNIPLPPIAKIKGENEIGSNIPLPPSFGVSESKIPSPPLVTDSKIPPPLLTNSNPLSPPICVGFSVFPPSTISIPSPPPTQSQIPPSPSNTFIPPPPKILPNLSSNNGNTSQTNPTFIPPPPTLVDLPPIDSSIPPPPILTKTIIPSPPELNISNNSNSFKETDLKSQILSVKLKKSTGENSQPVKPKDPRDELLSSIRAGVVLKKAAERVLTQKPKAKQAFDVFSVLQTAIKDKFKSLHSEYDEESSELDEDW